MKQHFDHREKYERRSVSPGRSRRERASSRVGESSVRHAGCDVFTTETSTTMEALGYLAAAATAGISTPTSIEDDLAKYLDSDEALQESMIQSLERLEGQLEEAEIRAFLEHDPEEEEVRRPVIEVRASFDDIDTYRSLKSQVRDIVREEEKDGTMIYTKIDRVS